MINPLEPLLLATQSAAADASSGVMDLGELTIYSVQVVFTGSNVAGTLALYASDDNKNFFVIPSSSQSITSSVGYLYSVTAAGYRYVYAKWTYTSGAGNITITGKIKNNVVSYK